eukprot:gene12082-12172_t
MSGFPVFEVLQGRSDSRILLLCDHASAELPVEYGTLGMPAAQFSRHIAYDIGAAAVTRQLSQMLGAPAVLSHFSRLLIDPNRGADDPTLVMRISDGALIPGNARIDAAEVDHRRRTYWQPYRNAIADQIAMMRAQGLTPVIVSVHSFTPVWKGALRPWDIAILWDKDPRLAGPVIGQLHGQGLVVGDNEPYDGALKGDTLYEHATRHGLANLLVEFRQDLIGDADGVQRWSDIFVKALHPVLSDPHLYLTRSYGSRADADEG